jgi:hypothetical protein
MKRNAEGSEDAEEDAEKDWEEFFHRQDAKEDKVSDLKNQSISLPLALLAAWRWKFLLI